MDKCQFCETDTEHLVVTKANDGHVHVHGPLEDEVLIRELANHALRKVGPEPPRKEVVFHNRQRLGDTLIFTCGVRDFKRTFPSTTVNVVSIAAHIWDNNPYIDRNLKPTEQNTVKIGPGILTNASNRLDWHFTNAYRVSIEDALKVHIPQGESRPDIWLTEEEYNAPRIDKDPYWVICLTGEQGWGCKMYPFQKWQQFVDQNKDIKFYQIGAKEDNPPRLKGENVVDYVGKTQDKDTGIRDLFKLFLNAEGSVSLVSFPMHLSAAFYKPAVVIAGAREPVHFTRYPGQQYLANDGCLPCSAVNACWHCDISKCTNLVNQVPMCVEMIHPDDISKALRQYYIGGRLSKRIPSPKPKLKNIVKKQKPSTGKFIKLISTARGWGGCARSITTIMKMLVERGHRVEFIPFRNKVTSREFLEFLSHYPQIKVTENYNSVSEPCDTCLVYADDYIWDFDKINLQPRGKKIMMLNYRRGKVGEIEWTKGWDYMFLNSTQEKELLSVLPGVKTKVLPPCTDLTEFFNGSQSLCDSIRLVRHSSQGDTKFAKDCEKEIDAVLACRPDVDIHMMPGPGFVNQKERFTKHGRATGLDLVNFLKLGNVFWYSLPQGYYDQGPRVILEAMAVGLPVIADNWGGAVDRITPDCGWLCNSKEEMIGVIKNLTLDEIREKGRNAKERAKTFDAEAWIREIL